MKKKREPRKKKKEHKYRICHPQKRRNVLMKIARVPCSPEKKIQSRVETLTMVSAMASMKGSDEALTVACGGLRAPAVVRRWSTKWGVGVRSQ